MMMFAQSSRLMHRLIGVSLLILTCLPQRLERNIVAKDHAATRILLAKRAADDLEGIFDHIANDSSQNASAMIGRILDGIALLKIFPHRTVVAGQSEKSKNPIRSISIKPYIAFFRVDDELKTVRVLRVRHGARKPL